MHSCALNGAYPQRRAGEDQDLAVPAQADDLANAVAVEVPRFGS